MIDSLLEDQAAAVDTCRDDYELEAENKRQAARIREFHDDLEMMTRERNKLMELSNSAQAQLRAATTERMRELSNHGVQTGILHILIYVGK